MKHGVIEPFLTFLFLFGAMAAAAAGAAWRRTTNTDRSMEMQILADRLGFTGFSAVINPQFVLGWCFLSRLSRGENRYAFNILEGTYHDQKLFVFDYHFEFDSDKDRIDHFCTIFMLVVPEAFPKLTIGPQNLLARIEETFDAEDIKFESVEFSKAYRVRCGDKKFAYDVCNPQMIEYLLANRGLDLEIQGPVISLAFAPQLPVSRIEFNLQRIAQIRALLPEYLFVKT